MARSKRKTPTAVSAARTDEETKAREKFVDAGSELSFPASDPPSYMGGAAVAGPPPSQPGEPPREPSVKTVSDPGEVKPTKRMLPAGVVQKSAEKKARSRKKTAVAG
jgi:hypothetical protein